MQDNILSFSGAPCELCEYSVVSRQNACPERLGEPGSTDMNVVLF